jgi:membrane protease YdiL (CAAX protease family)
MIQDIPSTALLPHLLLSLSLLTLWLVTQRTAIIRWSWLILLALAALVALAGGQLDPIAIPIILLLIILARASQTGGLSSGWRHLAGLAFTLAILALGLHLFPGFHPVSLFHEIRLSPDALPYNLNLNFDKALVGLLILGLFYRRPAWLSSWRQTLLTLLWILPLIITAVVALSLAIGYLRLEPKLIDSLSIWMWANLFFTCTAEEAFFRGLIQHRLAEAWENIRGGDWFALVIAAGLFGLAHLGGGWSYVLLASVAGFGYGLLYHQTGRIEASILGHFGLNLTHLLFFTYPALSS